MIGKLVEYIIEAGFNVLVLTRKEYLLLKISKEINKEMVSVDWALSRLELEVTYESLLLVTCNQRLQFLREAIEEKCKGVPLPFDPDDYPVV